MTKTIKIGHASISEHGTANGTAGDSTGNEVCIRADYNVIDNLAPNVVLRPKTATLAEQSAKACEAGCNNGQIGYSQNGRNTLYTLAEQVNYDLSAINVACNTDCSAFMTVCAIAGGANISYGSNAPTTTNMRTRFKQSGNYVVLTDAEHLSMTDYLKRGDILVHEGRHTLMVLENGSQHTNEPAIDEPSSPDNITTIVKINTKIVDIRLVKAMRTSATVLFKAVNQKTGNTAEVMSASALKNYDWKYQLENVDKKVVSVPNTFTPTSNQYSLNLTGLTPKTAYALQIFAAKNGANVFCSPKIFFTTLADNSEQPKVKQKFNCETTSKIKNIYIKVNDEFKHTVIHKNI